MKALAGANWQYGTNQNTNRFLRSPLRNARRSFTLPALSVFSIFASPASATEPPKHIAANFAQWRFPTLTEMLVS